MNLAISRYPDSFLMRLMFPKGKTFPFQGDPICPSPNRGMAISFRPGLLSSLFSEGCSYSYSNLLDSFYLPVSVLEGFNPDGLDCPRDNSYMGKLLDDLSKRSRVHAHRNKAH